MTVPATIPIKATAIISVRRRKRGSRMGSPSFSLLCEPVDQPLSALDVRSRNCSPVIFVPQVSGIFSSHFTSADDRRASTCFFVVPTVDLPELLRLVPPPKRLAGLSLRPTTRISRAGELPDWRQAGGRGIDHGSWRP